MNTRYGTLEKLKEKKKIDALFERGTSFTQFPIRVIYQKIPFETSNDWSSKIGVSVSKRNFKKAVNRNKIKRLLREGYRKNKYLVDQDLGHAYIAMLLYIGKEMPTYESMHSTVQLVLKKLNRKLKSQ